MNSKFRVLLIEDDPDDAFLVEETLTSCPEDTFAITRVEKIGPAIELLLCTPAFDVVLLDLSLPDSCGIETFIDLYTTHIRLPIIVLTGLRDEAMAVRMFRLGAQGYLVKGVNDLALLPHAIRYGIEQFAIREAVERKTSEEQLVRMVEVLSNLWPRIDDNHPPTLTAATPELPLAIYTQYSELLQQFATGGENEMEALLTPLVETFIAAHLGPRELAACHLAAVRELAESGMEVDTWGYGVAGYLLLIRIMGYLLLHYQDVHALESISTV